MRARPEHKAFAFVFAAGFCVLFYWAFGSAVWGAILALGELTGWW